MTMTKPPILFLLRDIVVILLILCTFSFSEAFVTQSRVTSFRNLQLQPEDTPAPTFPSPTFSVTLAPEYEPEYEKITETPIISTSSPTLSPTSLPTTSSPTTKSPTTSVPSLSPTFSPTKLPTTISPSLSPTLEPRSTQVPTTDFPTLPAVNPTTSSPTRSPITQSPTLLPTTKIPSHSPTFAPTTAKPTNLPTLSPTTAKPTTATPTTTSPTTASPTRKPTRRPTEFPTKKPTTSQPTTSSPTTTSPTTSIPTSSPTTSSPSFTPTKAPTSASPTLRPTTLSPTLATTTGLITNLVIDTPLPGDTLEEDEILFDHIRCFISRVLALNNGSKPLHPAQIIEFSKTAPILPCDSSFIDKQSDSNFRLCRRLVLEMIIVDPIDARITNNTPTSNNDNNTASIEEEFIDILPENLPFLLNATFFGKTDQFFDLRVVWGEGSSLVLLENEFEYRIIESRLADSVNLQTCENFPIFFTSTTGSTQNPPTSSPKDGKETGSNSGLSSTEIGLIAGFSTLAIIAIAFVAISRRKKTNKQNAAAFKAKDSNNSHASPKPKQRRFPSTNATNAAASSQGKNASSFSHIKRWLQPSSDGKPTPIKSSFNKNGSIISKTTANSTTAAAVGTSRASATNSQFLTGTTAAGRTINSENSNFQESPLSLAEFSIDLTKLRLGKKIGEGANGRIFRARYAGSAVAVKELFATTSGGTGTYESKTTTDLQSVESFYREFAHLRLLKHPNIIQLYGLAVAQSADNGAARYLLVMELADCSLASVLRPNFVGLGGADVGSPIKTRLNRSTTGDSDVTNMSLLSHSSAAKENPSLYTVPHTDAPLAEKIRWQVEIAQQICSGGAFIHHKNMIHFDLKPANILLKNGDAKICDLGIAKVLNDKNVLEVSSPKFGGTPSYMAPELLKGEMHKVTTKVDVYAFGVILWQLFHRDSAHPKEWSIPKLFHEVMVNDYRPMINPLITPEPISNLIESCWNSDPEKRPTFSQISIALEQFQPDEENEIFEDDLISVSTYRIGDFVRMWSPIAKRLMKGTVVNVHPNGTYDVEFVNKADDSVSLLVAVNGLDLAPVNNNGAEGVTILSTIHSQQSITGLAVALASRRVVNQVLRQANEEQGFAMDSTASKRFIAKNKNSKITVMEESKNTTLPFCQLSLKFLPSKMTDGGDQLQQLTAPKMNSLSYKYDGSQLEMQGLVFANHGIVVKASTSLNTSKLSQSFLDDDVEDEEYNHSGGAEKDPDGDIIQLPNASIDKSPQKTPKSNGVNESFMDMNHAEMIGQSWKSVLAKVTELGRGAAGSVYSAVHLPTFTIVAVKEIRFADRSSRHQTAKELKALWHNISPLNSVSDSSCPNIVKFHDAFLDPEREAVSIVIEFMDGGSLQDLIDSFPHSSHVGITNEAVLARITRDVLTGLEFMHSRSIAHLDIKPGNILLNTMGEAKIADFGLARQLEREGFFQATTFVGTTKYMSPERLRGEKYSFEADIWSLGLTIIAVATGKYPISLGSNHNNAATNGNNKNNKKENNNSAANAAAGGVYWSLLSHLENEPLPGLPPAGEFSDDAIDFIAQCLNLEPTLRPSAADLLQHPWIVKHGNSYLDANMSPIDFTQVSKIQLSAVAKAVSKSLYSNPAFVHILEHGEVEASCEIPMWKVQMLANQLHSTPEQIQKALIEAITTTTTSS